mgnify:CR=1 FL=1
MKHENVVLFDKLGNPSIMVKYTPEAGKPVDPMFIICGEEMEAIYISKYTNTMVKGLPCSLPFMKPVGGMDFDKASAACRAKGEGWHIMTNTEWEYLLNESRAAGTMPHGNTDSGKYYFDKSESGEVYDGCHTLPGTGPLTWSNTHDVDGVFDLCGNFWEWVAGLRLKKGVIQYIENNDAAVADLSPDSEAWKSVEAAGETVKLSAEGAGVVVTTDEPADDWNGCRFKDMEIRLDEVPDILQKLGIIPENQKEEMAGIFADSAEEETLPIRGSSFGYTSDGGPSNVHLHYPRSYVGNGVGFRSAFFKRKTENR